MSTEPNDIQPTPGPPQPPPPPASPPLPRPGPPGTYKPKRSTGKIAAAIVIGTIGVILGAIGTVGVIAHAVLRDDDGYYTVSSDLEARSYALTTDQIDLGQVSADVPDALLGKIRVQATSTNGKPLFLGIGPTADVNRYLSGVGYRQVDEISTDRSPRYQTFPGHAPRSLPGRQDFWDVQSQGPGQQTILWDLKSGNWKLVAMNADGSRGVSINSGLGAKAPWVFWVGMGFLIVAIIAIIGAILLAISSGRRTTPPPQTGAGTGASSA